MEYLVSEPAQQQYAKANYEYPVLKGVALDPVISNVIGEIDVDKIPLTEIVKHRKQASLLVDKVGFDQ
ncbi:Iron deficiency-induced protein A precursor [compost metagenome]